MIVFLLFICLIFVFGPCKGSFTVLTLSERNPLRLNLVFIFQMIRSPDSDQSRLKRFLAQGVKDHKAFEKYFVAETDTIG